MKPTFGPLTAASFRSVTRRAPDRSMLGFVMYDAGFMPLMVVGVYPDEDRYVLFSDWSDYLRKRISSFGARRAVVMAAKKAVETMATLDKPVDALASPRHDGTAMLLERMGFQQLDGKIYRFQLSMRDKVLLAEREMVARGTPVDIPVTHHFANRGTEHGAYAREILIPAGAMVTGKTHKTEQINVLLEGVIRVSTENGVERLVGPRVVVSPAGTKRIAVAETDVRWLTFHATQEADLEKIEAQFIAKDEPLKLYGGAAGGGMVKLLGAA